MKALGLILALICISSVLSAKPTMVVEIFRHGIRSPESNQFDDTWANIGYGELTTAGMRQQYILGGALKELYEPLLLPYDASKIYIQSTQENRTIMSALSQLYGIYKGTGPELKDKYPAERAVPPYNSKDIQDILAKLAGNNAAIPDKYLPLPVHSLLKQGDTLLQSYLNCPNSNIFYQQQLNDSTVQEVFAELKDTVDSLNKKGLPVSTIFDLDHLGDAVIADSANQVDLPGKIDPKSTEYRDIKFWAHWYEIYPTLNMTLQRQLFSGPLLNNVLSMFQQKRTNSIKTNFVFYAAKESLLASLLSALGIMTPECLLDNWRAEKRGEKNPPFPDCKYPIYASSLIFEFYNETTPYVMFKYNGDTVQLCDKKDTCTLTEFANVIQKATNGYDLAKFNKWCGTTTAVQMKETLPASWNKTNIVMAGVIVALLVSLVVLCLKAKKMKEYDSPSSVYTHLEVVSR